MIEAVYTAEELDECVQTRIGDAVAALMGGVR